MTGDRVYRFGPFDIDARTAEIRRAGVVVRLAEKPARLLLLLVAHAGATVSRQALQDHLWPDTHVDRERGLNNAMNRLREALGDVPGAPRYIATVPKRGYQFIAPVALVDVPARPRSAAWMIAAAGVLLVAFGLWRHAARDDALARAARRVASDEAAFALETLERVERGAEDPIEAHDVARRAAQHALALAPELTDGHLALALVYMRMEYRWEDAERELQQYLALTPRSAIALRAYADLLGAQGRFAEAESMLTRARLADLWSAEIEVHAARLLLFAGRTREAIDHARAVIARAPASAPAYKVLSDALWVDHQRAASERAYLEWLAALHIDERELERARALVNEGGLVGLWRSNFSRPAPPGQRHYGLAFKHASIYAAMRDAIHALDALETAEAQRDPQLIFLKVNPVFVALRDQRRFQDLLGRLYRD
jgi:DNA-binding winged helix-turn-helix (wHTH) protein/Tfp pilus assembly protein PilF